MYAGHKVEEGTLDEISDEPRHPYTQGLLRSMPEIVDDPADTRVRLPEIPGSVPDLLRGFAGCPFAPRCPSAMSKCRELPGLHPPWRSPVREMLAGVGRGRSPRPIMTDRPLLAVDELQVHYRLARPHLFAARPVLRAVDGVSLTVDRGRTLGLVGESGCGKTTLGLAVLRLVEPTGGTVTFDGVELQSLDAEALLDVRRRIQIIFQDPYSSLNPRQTAGDIVRSPLEVQRVGSPVQREERVAELFSLVGLRPNQRNLFPHQFSGGQRQRISIARALALNPDFIVCDEPVSALDVAIQAQILNLLGALQEELRLTVPVHLPRPGGGAAHLRRDCGDVPGRPGGEDQPPDALPPSPSSVYQSAALGGARPAFSAQDGTNSTGGRHSQSDQRSARVPVPHSMRPRSGTVPRGSPDAGGESARSLGGVPFRYLSRCSLARIRQCAWHSRRTAEAYRLQACCVIADLDGWRQDARRCTSVGIDHTMARRPSNVHGQCRAHSMPPPQPCRAITA